MRVVRGMPGKVAHQAGVHADNVDLAVAVAIGHERDLGAVWRPTGVGIYSGVLDDLVYVRAVHVGDVDVDVQTDAILEHDSPPILRPIQARGNDALDPFMKRARVGLDDVRMYSDTLTRRGPSDTPATTKLHGRGEHAEAPRGDIKDVDLVPCRLIALGDAVRPLVAAWTPRNRAARRGVPHSASGASDSYDPRPHGLRTRGRAYECKPVGEW